MIDIVGRINELADEKGWSGYELSKRTGISANAVYGWNRAESKPSLANILKICEAMDLSLEQFFCGTEKYNLNEDERRLLNEWFALSELEKDAIFNMIETFKILKRDNG